VNFSSFYLYNRWYTFPSSSSVTLKCHVNLNWGKKIQTETIQFCDIIFTQSDIYTEHNNGCHSQKHFTSALCVHKNTLLLRYVFTKIFYFYIVFTKIVYFHTMCSQKYFTSTLCVHKNILLLHYVFTKIFYFYAMCSQKYFNSIPCVHKNILLPQYVFTKIFYFYAICSQQ